MRAAFLAGLLALTASCTESTDPGTGGLSVRSGDGILQIQNGLRERAFYFVYEREAAAAVDWAPCVEPSRCLSLAPESRADLAYATIVGYQPGKREAIVWWWVAVGPPDQAVPGPLHHVVTGLE